MDYPDVPWPCHFCRSGARVLWKFIDQVPVHHPTGTVVLSWVPVEVTLVLQVMAPMSRQQYLGWPDA